MEEGRRKVSVAGEQFLIADFQALYEQRIALQTTTNSEINIFLLVVSAFAVGIGFLTDMKITDNLGLLLVIGTASAFLALIGYATFYRTVNARIQITTYVRFMNRIRRYFVDKDARLSRYLPPYVYDDGPSYLQISQDTSKCAPVLSNTLALIIVTSALSGCSALSFVASLQEASILSLNDTSQLLSGVGFATLLIVSIAMLKKQDSMLKSAQTNTSRPLVNFPRPKKEAVVEGPSPDS